jgi:hypothetical protein
VDDAIAAMTLFKLRIEIDQDDIGWSHFFGIGHQLTLNELPPTFQKQARRTLEFMKAHQMWKLERFPERPSEILINNRPTTLPDDTPENFIEVLTLLAWWMEWSQRKLIARDRDKWFCPECDGDVMHQREHCNDTQCVSWNVLRLCTGEPTLHIVPKTGTDDLSS